MSGPSPPIAAGRREAILAAALELFRERGFHAVGIDEIGTSAGISGPGVYRHFPSKSSLLVALFDSISERMLAAAEEIRIAGAKPEDTLGRLVDFHVATALAERALLAVWIRDYHSVPADDRRRIADRQADYVAIWVAALTRLRPELGPSEAQTLVHAALGAIDSIALHDSTLAAPKLEATLAEAARAVLSDA